MFVSKKSFNSVSFPGCIEWQYTADDRDKSCMEFVLREEDDKCFASVLTVTGTLIGVKQLVAVYQAAFPARPLQNQVSNQWELKAMYQAGLRIDGHERLGLEKSKALLKANGSVLMRVEK